MSDIATVTMTGRTAAAPEMSYTPEGKAITNVNFASSYWTKEGDKTSWVRLTFWNKQAEAVNEHVVKGQQLTVVGSLRIENYTLKDGTKGTSVKVSVTEVSFGAKPKGYVEEVVEPLGGPETW
jgi:single-strand DNA-binding protein